MSFLPVARSLATAQFYSLFSVQEGKESELTYAVSFLPVARSLATAQFYSHLDGKRIADGVTEIVAMDFGKRLYIFLSYFTYSTYLV